MQIVAPIPKRMEMADFFFSQRWGTGSGGRGPRLDTELTGGIGQLRHVSVSSLKLVSPQFKLQHDRVHGEVRENGEHG